MTSKMMPRSDGVLVPQETWQEQRDRIIANCVEEHNLNPEQIARLRRLVGYVGDDPSTIGACADFIAADQPHGPQLHDLIRAVERFTESLLDEHPRLTTRQEKALLVMKSALAHVTGRAED